MPANDLRALAEGFDFEDATPPFVELFETACRTLDTIHDLEALVASDGLVTRGSKDQTTIHPAVVELRHQRAAYARLLEQLGLDRDPAETMRQRQSRIARKRRLT